MGFLIFDGNDWHLKRIKTTLKRRNLSMDETDEWEIHGPHGSHGPDMNYQVYVGRAYEELDHNLECTCSKSGVYRCEKHKNGFEVAIYPKSVYYIEDNNGWSYPDPDNKIEVKKK